MKPASVFGLVLISGLLIVFVGSVVPFTYVIVDDPSVIHGPFARILPPFDPDDIDGSFYPLIGILSYWLGVGTTDVLTWVCVSFCASLTAAALIAFCDALHRLGARAFYRFAVAIYCLTPLIAGILCLMYLYALVFRDPPLSNSVVE